jgi:hypothetical protein
VGGKIERSGGTGLGMDAVALPTVRRDHLGQTIVTRILAGQIDLLTMIQDILRDHGQSSAGQKIQTACFIL